MKQKEKKARTREMVCEFVFKQNVGHLGKIIRIGAVHGHNMTMKFEWPTVLKEFWDRQATHAQFFGFQFFALLAAVFAEEVGDFFHACFKFG